MASMDFVVYQIANPAKLEEKATEFLAELRDFPMQQEERDLSYCITSDIAEEDGVITGSLSQEHAPLTDSFDEEKVLYSPDDTPAVHTFFSIDLKEKLLLVQLRDYSAPALDKDITKARLTRIVGATFRSVYTQEINLIATEREYNEDELLKVFNSYRVSYLRIKIGSEGKLLRDHTSVFEDKKQNQNWISSWNEDGSNLSEVILKAPGKTGEGDLRHSPLAKTLLQVPSKSIEEFFYWDKAGKQNKITKNGFRRFKVQGIDIYSHPITAIPFIKENVRKRTKELKSFKVIQDL